MMACTSALQPLLCPEPIGHPGKRKGRLSRERVLNGLDSCSEENEFQCGKTELLLIRRGDDTVVHEGKKFQLQRSEDHYNFCTSKYVVEET